MRKSNKGITVPGILRKNTDLGTLLKRKRNLNRWCGVGPLLLLQEEIEHLYRVRCSLVQLSVQNGGRGMAGEDSRYES